MAAVSTHALVPGPTHSADGRFWWDGHQWHPATRAMGNLARSPLPVKRSVRRQIVRGALIGLVLLVIHAALAVVYESRRSSEMGRQVHDAYCERFGQDNPDCLP